MVELNVDNSVLSDNLFKSKTGFTVSPPKDWNLTDKYNLELENQILNQTKNKLLAVYKADSSNCALIISEPDIDFNSLKSVILNTGFNPEKDSIWLSVQTSFFTYKQFEIVQSVYQNSELLIFRLYIRELKELFELDYVIPNEDINKTVRSVESSIGSISKLITSS